MRSERRLTHLSFEAQGLQSLEGVIYPVPGPQNEGKPLWRGTGTPKEPGSAGESRIEQIRELLDDAMTVPEVAEELGISQSLVRRHMRGEMYRSLEGVKVGKEWFTFPENVKDFKNQPKGKGGRPPKKK